MTTWSAVRLDANRGLLNLFSIYAGGDVCGIPGRSGLGFTHAALQRLRSWRADDAFYFYGDVVTGLDDDLARAENPDLRILDACSPARGGRSS